MKINAETVGQLIDALAKFPRDASLHVHWEGGFNYGLDVRKVRADRPESPWAFDSNDDDHFNWPRPNSCVLDIDNDRNHELYVDDGTAERTTAVKP